LLAKIAGRKACGGISPCRGLTLALSSILRIRELINNPRVLKLSTSLKSFGALYPSKNRKTLNVT
jgi:hypothetical protein